MRQGTWGICLRSSSRVCAALAAAAVVAGPARAGSLNLWESASLEYKVVLSYGLAQRMQDAEEALINGPIDPLVSHPDGTFGHTGLPITINFDDANRNFEKGSLINSRGSTFGKALFNWDLFDWGQYGAVLSGSYFYDRVFQKVNDNTSPDTVNNDVGAATTKERTIPVNAFTRGAKAISGERDRLLEAYVHGNWSFGDNINLNLRLGRHLMAWGESLFFPGIVSSQGPFDATKAFVPGTEIEEIILPVKQVSAQFSFGDFTVLGLYQFEFKPTDIFPMGDFFSPADLVGPGSTFGYGSINPVYSEGDDDPCTPPPTNQTAAVVCLAAVGGNGLTNVPKNIVVTRQPDILPNEKDKPWGAGLKYQLTPNLNLGAYYMKYNNHNPYVRLNMGYATFGEDAVTGEKFTTELVNQKVPVSYNVAYADNIELYGASFSTVLWVFNVAGEVFKRKNIDTSVAADISDVRSPVATRGEATQVDLSLLYVVNPDFLFYDEVVVVGEAGGVRLDDVVPGKVEEGIDYLGNRDVLFYDRESVAVSVLVLPKGRNVFSGWDLSTPISFSWLAKGTPSIAGAFGSLYGEGDMRFSMGLTLQFLQNLEFSTAYNGFLGDPNKHIDQGSYGSSYLKANPYVDRDYLSFTVKYNL